MLHRGTLGSATKESMHNDGKLADASSLHYQHATAQGHLGMLEQVPEKSCGFSPLGGGQEGDGQILKCLFMFVFPMSFPSSALFLKKTDWDRFLLLPREAFFLLAGRIQYLLPFCIFSLDGLVLQHVQTLEAACHPIDGRLLLLLLLLLLFQLPLLLFQLLLLLAKLVLDFFETFVLLVVDQDTVIHDAEENRTEREGRRRGASSSRTRRHSWAGLWAKKRRSLALDPKICCRRRFFLLW